jgi:hypothetical protein
MQHDEIFRNCQMICTGQVEYLSNNYSLFLEHFTNISFSFDTHNCNGIQLQDTHSPIRLTFRPSENVQNVPLLSS